MALNSLLQEKNRSNSQEMESVKTIQSILFQFDNISAIKNFFFYLYYMIGFQWHNRAKT